MNPEIDFLRVLLSMINKARMMRVTVAVFDILDDEEKRVQAQNRKATGAYVYGEEGTAYKDDPIPPFARNEMGFFLLTERLRDKSPQHGFFITIGMTRINLMIHDRLFSLQSKHPEVFADAKTEEAFLEELRSTLESPAKMLRGKSFDKSEQAYHEDIYRMITQRLQTLRGSLCKIKRTI